MKNPPQAQTGFHRFESVGITADLRSLLEGAGGYCVVQAAFFVPERPRPTKLRLSGRLLLRVVKAPPLKLTAPVWLMINP